MPGDRRSCSRSDRRRFSIPAASSMRAPKAAALLERRAVLLVGPARDSMAVAGPDVASSAMRRSRSSFPRRRRRPSGRLGHDRAGDARRPADADRALRARSARQRDARQQAGHFGNDRPAAVHRRTVATALNELIGNTEVQARARPGSATSSRSEDGASTAADAIERVVRRSGGAQG